ncbi:MAG: efflux RND transporter permease subunit [Bacteroidota bacterium]|nr:efflux RND transporter permease subunit [Bacteroidota bacterium]MDP4233486.1 efflux RND transporter permease subunit [Bacteroidota bacterium]MDP4243364.1 efflux RND transporter permease subunit [Bacteroidota bacterium]MDP4287950.1 efflux RND transporter permease subunit [Bacteroidota bacterium]
MWLTRLALKYPISAFLIGFTILVLGVVSLLQLPIDLLPNISIPVVTTITFYTGASPKDMEQSVTAIVERGVSSVNDVNYVQSATREGISQVRINFNWSANVDVGLIDVIQRLNRIVTQLPTGVQPPISLRFDITNLPVITLAISGDMNGRDLYDLAYNTIEPQLEHVTGVASAQVIGGQVREIHVTVDRNRIQAIGMPITTVMSAIANANLIVPSGDLKSGVFDYSLKTESLFNLVKPIGDIVLKDSSGVPIRIRDVATVDDSYQEETETIRVDGRSGLVLRVQKLATANTVSVVDNIIEAIPKLTGVPSNVHIALTFDQSTYIRQTINGLSREAMIGSLLAMAIIMIFLRNIRGTIIIIVAIPLSILITFIMFRFGNITLNIMTFGGLALAVGRLVDDSIVELEAISRHYNNPKPGESKHDQTLAAASEVATPIFVSTLTTVIVFLPVVFLTGIAKLLFTPLTLTIAVALFGSFFVSRTITPLLCLRFLPPEKEMDRKSRKRSDRLRVFFHDAIERIDQKYENMLEWSLKHRKVIMISILTLAAVSVFLFKFIGTEFFPDQDESVFTVSIKNPVGTRIEETTKTVMAIEDILRKSVPEMNAMVTDIGVPSAKSGNFFGRNTGEHAANIQVSLVPTDERKRTVFQIMDSVRPKLSNYLGAVNYVSASGFLRFLLNFGSAAPIDIEVRGYDLDQGSALSKQVLAAVRSTPGAVNAQSTREDDLPELRINIDRDKAGILGITVAQISNTINAAINGAVASLYTDPQSGNAYNILVRFDEKFRKNPDDLRKLLLTTPSGQQVLLGSVATITQDASPVEIDRKYQQRIIDVTAEVSGRDLGSVAQEIQTKLDKIAVPPGFQVKLGGNVEQQQKTFGDLTMAFGLAILLVYVVMASQFQSLADPFIIMFTVPFGIVGVLWALFLTGTTLSVTSFQGIIVMVGIVVSNGILLVDYTNHLRMKGESLQDAVIHGGRTRLKPILMTSLATVLGLIPMAIGMGGEKTQAPLAIAVIGGLTLSTLLTLFFVPTLYTIFEERFRRKLAPEEGSVAQ